MTEPKTILLVDDEPEVRNSTAMLLEALAYRVLEAQDAESAMAALAQFRPIDLLLTDVILPGGVNGTELATKALKTCPDLKVILTTGRPEMASGSGLPLICKPFRIAELSQAIDEALGGSGNAA